MDIKNIVVTDILEAITVHSVKGNTLDMRNRCSYGLSLCSKGRITYIQNGKSYISDCDHAVILPKGANYTLRRDKTGSFPLINFECSNFICDTITVVEIKDKEFLFNCFEQINNALIRRHNRLKAMSIFYDMLSTIFSDRSTSLIAPALLYIDNNYSCNELSNAFLAEKCKISEIYFRRVFREKLGVSPRQYIIDIRINRAKQLLSEGQKKISAIAEECGFSTSYHFCRSFKEHVGMTPSKYRDKNIISLL